MKKSDGCLTFLIFCVMLVVGIVALIIAYCVCDLFGIQISEKNKFSILILFVSAILSPFIVRILRKIKLVIRDFNAEDDDFKSNRFESADDSNKLNQVDNINKLSQVNSTIYNCRTVKDEFDLDNEIEELEDRASKNLVAILLILLFALLAFYFIIIGF